jgi:vitamin B12 transporter
MTRLYLLATACLAVAPAAYAQEADQITLLGQRITPVSEVVVTATRLPSPLEVTPGARVVTEAEIEARGAVFATDVLETIPGINVNRNGAFGGVSYARQRGQTNDKTLVLIDGVPVNDPSQPTGGFDFSAFDLADIARVEVLSGPQGSLWGSDAIGGVISFTTRELDGLRGELEAGSFGTVRGSAAAGRATEAYAVGLSLSGLSTDGISKAENGTEDDGFETRTATVNGRYDVSERVTLDGRVRYNGSEAEIDGYDANFAFGDTDEVYETETVSGFGRVRVADALGFDHAVSVSLFETERVGRGGGFPYSYDADRQLYRYTAERAEPGEVYALAFGLEREDTAATLSDGSEADLGATAAFAVLRLTPNERLTLTGSARYDDPDRYDGEGTLRAAAAYELGGGFTVAAAYGQGFKTPSISQTACDFCFPMVPVDLEPERAEGADLRLGWASADDRFDAALTAYRIEVEDQIDFVFNPDFTSRYANIDETRSEGLEAEASARLGGGFALRAAYAFTETEDLETGLPLLRAPEHQGSAVLTYARDRLSGAVTVRAESEQDDSDPSTFARIGRDGFVVADVAGAYALTEQVHLTLRVENLLDEDFQQVLGYGEPGRAAYVGLRLRR